jgi:hypothetical protein
VNKAYILHKYSLYEIGESYLLTSIFHHKTQGFELTKS